MGSVYAAVTQTLAPDALTRLAWKVMENDRANLGLPDLTVVDLQDFLKAAEDPAQNPNILSHDDRELVLNQAETMIGNLYPHLPFKVQDFPDADPPVDPIGAIQALRARVDADDPPLGELDFHIEMLKIFASVRDPHTGYALPRFFRGVVAFLPFRVGVYVDANMRNRFMVTSVMEGFVHADFRPGAELISPEPGFPDFTPIVNHAAMLSPGANAAAQMQKGILRLTVLPLSTSATSMWSPPYENPGGNFTYLPRGSSTPKAITLPWGVARATGLGQNVPGETSSISQDLCAMRDAANLLWNRHQCHRIASALSGQLGYAPAPYPSVPAPPAPSPPPPPKPKSDSLFPDVFEFQTTQGISTQADVAASSLTSSSQPNKQFGYIALKSFSTALSADLSVDLPNEFARILKLIQPQAPDGLIIDIRGNPGGDIVAAENMLHMLTPAQITPANFHLANTPAMGKILDAVSAAPGGSALTAWIPDRKTPSAPDGPWLTSGQPLTTSPNALGQMYQGPVVLLTDSLTYSAADIFTGGFADNRIGRIIGVDPSTGGGGASVWTYDRLTTGLPVTDLNLPPLPQGTQMSVAFMRSSRVGMNLEVPIEDRGVAPDLIFPRTLNDLLATAGAAHIDLLTFACDTLAAMPVHRIDAALLPGKTQMSLAVTNLDKIDFLLDQNSVPVRAIPVASISSPITIPTFPDGSPPGQQITIRGFSGGGSQPVATTRLVLVASEELVQRRRDG